MKKRSVASVVLLTIVTIGIYEIVWLVKTKNEMNSLGANIPTAWLIIIPIANIYWLWKYCEGVALVTKEKVSTIMSFILFWLIGLVGMAIVQNEFNELSSEPSNPILTEAMPQAQEPAAPLQQTQQPQAQAEAQPDQLSQPVEQAAPTQDQPPQTPVV